MPAIPFVAAISAYLATTVTIAGISVSAGTLLAAATITTIIAVNIINGPLVKEKLTKKENEAMSKQIAVAILTGKTTIVTGLFHKETEKLTSVEQIDGDTLDSDLANKFASNKNMLTLENF